MQVETGSASEITDICYSNHMQMDLFDLENVGFFWRIFFLNFDQMTDML